MVKKSVKNTSKMTIGEKQAAAEEAKKHLRKRKIMKLDKISIDGKKDSIEVLDKIFSAKN